MRTHKDQVDAVVREYAGVPPGELPRWLRIPRTEHEFDLAFAVAIAVLIPSASPENDAGGFLTGCQGVRLRDAPP